MLNEHIYTLLKGINTLKIGKRYITLSMCLFIIIKDTRIILGELPI